MLSEQFIASIGTPSKPPGTHVARDAAIFIHEYKPLLAQRAVFKKSATQPNCLAVSSTHVFAAQAEKGIVHVYSRQNGNQEAIVPFTDRITCLALACEDTVLILGTTEGRLLLWETASGRQVSTAQTHVQAVTQIVVDPTQNFLLSASEDSTVHLLSLPALLSFSSSGVQAPTSVSTFTAHSAGITALAVGHGSSFSNFAVSASKDRTCFVWDYHTNSLLRTYLLPAVPTCLAIDAVDQRVYVGYEDGSVQKLDMYQLLDSTNLIQHGGDISVPVQPPPSSRWASTDASVGAVRSLALSFDSCSLLAGQESGQITLWDVAKGRQDTNFPLDPLPGPVNNLSFLPVTGISNAVGRGLRVPTVKKPKFNAFDTATGSVPGNYSLDVELADSLCGDEQSLFEAAFDAPAFPASRLDEGLREIFTWQNKSTNSKADFVVETEDFMALKDTTEKPRQMTLAEQNATLKSELEALRRVQAATFDKMERLSSEKNTLLQRERKRLRTLFGDDDVAMVNGNGRAHSVDDDSSD